MPNEHKINIVKDTSEKLKNSSDKYKEFANMPSKEESLAKMVMMINQPMTSLVSTLNGSMVSLLGALNNLKNTKS